MKCTKGGATIVLLILVSISTFFSGSRSRASNIDKIAHWIHSPTIRVCNVAPVSVHKVATAARWWQDLGYEFDLIYSSDCSQPIQLGTITITLDEGELIMNNLLGRTTFYSDPESGEMLWVKIELKTPYIARVLEHELGHALGWHHVRAKGHMMHPQYFSGGWDSRGLDN